MYLIKLFKYDIKNILNKEKFIVIFINLFFINHLKIISNSLDITYALVFKLLLL